MGNSNSKAEFSSALESLVSKNVPSGDALWNTVFGISSVTWTEVSHLISFDSVRRMMLFQPANLVSLISRCIEGMELFLASTTQTDTAEQDRVLMYVRILSRIIPLLHEPWATTAFMDVYFPGQVDAGHPFSGFWSPSIWQFARKCCRLVMRLLFVPGFTSLLRKRQDQDVVVCSEDEFNPFLCWENGMLVKKGAHTTSAALEKNRTEMLRLVVVMLSDVLHIHSSDMTSIVARAANGQSSTATAGSSKTTAANAAFTPARGPFSDALLLESEDNHAMPHTADLLYSLVNMICSYQPESVVPYAQSILPENPRNETVRMAIIVLAAILDYAPAENAFHRVFRSIQGIEDLGFVYEGMTRLLSNPMRAASAYLPSSTYVIDFVLPLLTAFFRMLIVNSAFLVFVVNRPTVCQQVVIPLLFFIEEYLPTRPRFRIVECCMYILLVLSSVRQFGIALNEPYDQKAPLYPPNSLGEKPTFADLLTVMFFGVMLQGPDWVGSLYECVLTIMANVSPYMKSLNASASSRLVQMCEIFSKPAYLKGTPMNHVFICYLVEILNNLIQYHYEGNVLVVLEILIRRIVFEQLARVPEIPPPRPPVNSPASSANSPLNVPTSTSSSYFSADDKGKKPKYVAPASEEIALAVAAQEPSSSDPMVAEIIHERTWKSKMQIGIILRVLEVLVPQIDPFYNEHGVIKTQEFATFLRKTSLVGLLPPPPQIMIRQYTANKVTDCWMQMCIWSEIFQRVFVGGLLDPRGIRMFPVQLPTSLQHLMQYPVDIVQRSAEVSGHYVPGSSSTESAPQQPVVVPDQTVDSAPATGSSSSASRMALTPLVVPAHREPVAQSFEVRNSPTTHIVKAQTAAEEVASQEQTRRSLDTETTKISAASPPEHVPEPSFPPQEKSETKNVDSIALPAESVQDAKTTSLSYAQAAAAGVDEDDVIEESIG
eukprot:ANDGO_02673.mRNA.1 Protein HID1